MLVAAKLGIILLMALTPMLCIRFCEARHAVEHQLSADPHYLHHLAHGPAPESLEPSGHTPLEDAQQVMQAVTDLLPMAVAAVALILTAITLVSVPTPQRRWIALAPPTPPPKFTAA